MKTAAILVAGVFVLGASGAWAQDAPAAASTAPAAAAPAAEQPAEDASAVNADSAPVMPEEAVEVAKEEETAVPRPSDPYAEAMWLLDRSVYPAGEDKARLDELLTGLYAGGDRRYEVVFNLGVSALRAGDLGTAEARFAEAQTEAAAGRGDLATVLAMQGRVAATKGDFAGADALMNQALGANEYCSPALNHLARKALNSGNQEEALVLSRKALLGDPNNMDSYLTMAVVYYQTDRLELGILVCESALKINPAASTIHNILGLIYLKENEVRRAFDHFQKAVTADPENLDARRNLASLVLNYKDFPTALTLLDEVLKVTPLDRGMRMGKALALRGVGRNDEARKELELLITEDQSDREAAYNLCILLHEYVSDFEAALVRCRDFQRMIDSRHPKYAEMKKRVKGIQDTIDAMKEFGDKPRPAAEEKPAEAAPAEAAPAEAAPAEAAPVEAAPVEAAPVEAAPAEAAPVEKPAEEAPAAPTEPKKEP
jgi:tetratricopeptide (TPR) repeat protein